MKKVMVSLFIATFVLAIFNTASVNAQDEKFAYVDLVKVFNDYKKTEKYDKKLEEEKTIKEKEREKSINEIKDLQDKLSIVSKDEKDKTQKQIDEKLRGLQQFDSQVQMDLRKEYSEMMQEILKEINKVVRDYAEKNKITFVFKDAALAYGKETLDITEDIIKMLNEKFK
jgi:outer membrane protein